MSIKMKLFFLPLAALAICTSTVAQDTTSHPFIFEVYAGFPNTSNYFLYRDQVIDTVANSNYRTIGTPISIGVRGESFLNGSRFSVGGEVNYCLAGYRFNYWDSTQIQAETYTYTYKSSQLRFILRGSWYFIQHRIFEAYAVAGIGYRYIYRNHNSTAPDFTEIATENTFPWTGRLGLGFRIYPHRSIGILGEAGVFGGSIFQVGVSLRI